MDRMCGLECRVSQSKAVTKRGVGVGGVTPSAYASSRLAPEETAFKQPHSQHYAAS